MQDLPRDEYTLLNGVNSNDKDMCTSAIRSSSPHTTPKAPHAGPSSATHTETNNNEPISQPQDLYPAQTTSWHHSQSKLLLQSSDDPLISRGASAVADDDHPVEFNSVMAAKFRSESPSMPPASKPTAARARKKAAFKLRFHHQALPPEYLSHYEATQGLHIAKPSPSGEVPPKVGVQKSSHENVRNWLKKIAEMQKNPSPERPMNSESPQFDVNANVQKMEKPPRRVVKYSDLPYMGEMTLDNSKPRRGRKPKKADICHLIYKNYGTIFPGTPRDLMGQKEKSDEALNEDTKEPLRFEEPLNLCLRDQSDAFSLSSEDDSADSCSHSNCTTPLASACDPVTDALLASNLKVAMPNFDSSSSPMSVYYQKLLESGTQSSINGTLPPGVETITQGDQLTLKIPIRSGLFLPPSQPDVLSPNSSSKSMKSPSSQPLPQKRKRSAIFIPPMPVESSHNNPATEVSICKFKFTGGAKPTLQEKKMLSVDSDGNYRYYSGTGDKSMRGYEFFPRESLQQSGVVPGVNCAGAFLNATGERILTDLPPPSAGLSNELLQIPDSPTNGLLLAAPIPPAPGATANYREKQSNLLHQQLCERRKKNKSKRSSQKERLEKTFKENGFLIQTQQLESAEGATYCKFRQLKKFTRYLFRNWKDYLPGDLQLQQANAAAAAAAAAANVAQLQHHHLHHCAPIAPTPTGASPCACPAQVKREDTQEIEIN